VSLVICWILENLDNEYSIIHTNRYICIFIVKIIIYYHGESPPNQKGIAELRFCMLRTNGIYFPEKFCFELTLFGWYEVK